MSLQDIMGEIAEARKVDPEDVIPLAKETPYLWSGSEVSTRDPRYQTPKVVEMPTFNEDQQTQYTVTLVLTEEEAFWLHWRLSVHLWTYHNYQWPEMKAQLTKVVQRLEALRHGETNRETKEDHEADGGVGQEQDPPRGILRGQRVDAPRDPLSQGGTESIVPDATALAGDDSGSAPSPPGNDNPDPQGEQLGKEGEL